MINTLVIWLFSVYVAFFAYSERSKAEHNGSVNGNERLAFKVIPSHLAILHAFEKQPPVTIIYLYGHAWFNMVVVAT